MPVPVRCSIHFLGNTFKHLAVLFKLLFGLLLLSSLSTLAQEKNREITSKPIKLAGYVTDGSGPVPHVVVSVTEVNQSETGTAARLGKKSYVLTTDEAGMFLFSIENQGTYQLTVSGIGYLKHSQQVELTKDGLRLTITLTTDIIGKEAVVVTGSRHNDLQSKAPVLVNSIDAGTFRATASASLGDGLSFSPGARVENNCANCGFSAVRLNGLQGPYTQVLINSRPVYSALTSVYGLEQLPASIIDRVEIVRGAGSVLYGGNAIAGTVNILTREPLFNGWQAGSTVYSVGGRSLDALHFANASVMGESEKSGITIYGMARDRQAFDANEDGFTEITKLQNQTFGFQAFQWLYGGKLSVSGFALQEYRRGGSQLELPPHQASVAEELSSRAYNLNLNYEKDINYGLKLNTYASAQLTNRSSYYGGGGRVLQPGDTLDQQLLLAQNAYGRTSDFASVAGIQLSNSNANQDARLRVVLGAEWIHNQVADDMLGYGRRIRQQSHTIGSYAQATWQVSPGTQLVTGLRLDGISVLGDYRLGSINPTQNRNFIALVPRVALAQELWSGLARVGYAQGYRAPQAFDEDLHIETVGGTARFTRLSPKLVPERSHSLTASYTWNHGHENWSTSLMVEGFATWLPNAFVNRDQAADSSGFLVWEKENGSGLQVSGLNLEWRMQWAASWSIIAGGTVQQAIYNKAEMLWESAERSLKTSRLLRTPDVYGFANLEYRPWPTWRANLTSTFTGPMQVSRLVPDTGDELELRTTPAFLEVGLRLAKRMTFTSQLQGEFFIGAQNLTNAYQQDFDRGALRDATYIYGPMRPRTFYIGIKLGNFLGA